MNNTFKYIAAIVAFSAAALMSGLTANAQNLEEGTYIETNGVAYAKFANLEEGTDNKYLIDVKTFVTGEVTQTFEVHPADIVLVLDVSGSMTGAISTVSHYEPATVNGLYGSNYNNNTPTQYYYQYNNNYYPLYIGRGGTVGNRRYYLFFRVGGQTYYINTSGQVVTNQPNNVTSQNTNLLAASVQLYTQETTTTTKMDALKSAVKSFIDQIAHNDWYEDSTDDKRREKALGNQISIVKFADDSYYNYTSPTGTNPATDPNAPITPGNHFTGSYNRTEVLRGFTPTSSQDNVDDLKAAITGITAGGATAADYGMNLARNLINSLDADERSDSRKTIVFFTDGEPNHSSGFVNSVATAAILNSKDIKDIEYTETYQEDGQTKTRTVHPSVFSVGLFASTPTTGGNLENYMNYVSSNYPNATAYNNGGTQDSSDYYMDASGGTAEDLKKIFDAIAHSAGGSGNADLAGGSAITVDIVSSSFTAPKNATDVTVLVAPCIGKTTIDNKEYLTFGEPKAPTEYGLPAITATTDPETNAVSTTGFDFSENWCGPDPTSTSTIQPGYHGFQQILQFEIETNEDAVGGPAVETNDPESGIYLEGSDEPLIKFNRPTVKIPVQIWIQKSGLQGEDSAVFTLYRAPFAENFDPKTATWEQLTKIVVGPNDIDPETGLYLKKQVGLNPDYFYRIKEDAWAFGYTYQYGGELYTVGDNVENPFMFENVPNNKKFDEATARNIFNERTTPITPAEEEGGE